MPAELAQAATLSGAGTFFPSSVSICRAASHLAELGEPAVGSKVAHQRLQRCGGGFFQVKFACQQFDVLRGDIPLGNFQVEVWVLAADLRALS